MGGSIGTLLIAAGGIYIIYRAICVKKSGKVEEKDTPIAEKIADMPAFVSWYSNFMIIMGVITLVFAVLFAISDFVLKGALDLYVTMGLIVFITIMSIIANKGTKKFVRPEDMKEYKEEKLKKNKPEGK